MVTTMEAIIFVYVAITIAIAYYILSVLRVRNRYKHIPGRPTKGATGFLFGHALHIINVSTSHKVLPELFVEDIAKYGPVIKYSFLNDIIIHTVDPNAIKDILVTYNFPKHVPFYKSFGYPFNQRFIGEGLETDLNDEHWRRKRAHFNPFFYKQQIVKNISIFNSKSDILIEKLTKLANHKNVVALLDEFNSIGLDLIAHLGFSIEIDTINYENKLSHYVRTVTNQLDECLVDPYASLNPKKRKCVKILKENLKELREFAREKILERIESMKYNEYSQNDILSKIVKGIDNETEDIENMIDDFITFFVAGQETTSTTLSFFFLEIMKNPEIMNKLEKEINHVLGERSDLVSEDLQKFEYLDAVLRETLRLYPPGAYFSRVSSKEMIINGHKIPSGSWIMISAYSSARCEKFFPDPLKFDPDRFIDDEKKKKNVINSYTLFPFSIGQHHCIGQNFALVEAKVVIVKLLKHFNFDLDKTQSFDVTESLTLKPKDGTKCYLTLKKYQ